jgi:hypothetical protein
MAASAAVLRKRGEEWRTLFGRCDGWPDPMIATKVEDAGVAPAVELCEICRQPVGSDKPYVTNSAGERPVHLACSGE